MITAETLHPQYIKSQKGEDSLVVLPIKEFNRLIEDYNDLIVIEDRRNEEKISLQDLKQNLATSK